MLTTYRAFFNSFQLKRGAMPHMKVDDIFGIGPLDADRKRLRRMKHECNKTTSICRWGKIAPRQHAGVDLELEQSAVASIKPTCNSYTAGNLQVHNSLTLSASSIYSVSQKSTPTLPQKKIWRMQ